MGSKVCMNGLCGATTSPEWKKGWAFKSGGFSNLCYSCGIAYENLIFCERFHLNEPGWRECKCCEKPIHCGCVVSKYLYDYLDLGGIACILCLKAMGNVSFRPIQSSGDDVPNGFNAFSTISSWQSSVAATKTCANLLLDKGKLVQLSEGVEKHHQPPPPFPSQKGEPILSIGSVKKEGKSLPEFGPSYLSRKLSPLFPGLVQNSGPPPIFATADSNRPTLGLKDMYETMVQPPRAPPLGFSLGGATNSMQLPLPGKVTEGREQEKLPPFKQGQRTRHILPKLPKPGFPMRSLANNNTCNNNVNNNNGAVLNDRVARPPAEGRGRNQLLPRYWPRITDQELEKIAGDLNSTIVPLFEKILSASDAGRIGRLVLPKACAEAYFPSISNSEGLPIRIQDIKGKEWTFQFRFWPNNNSRMYVLEGVTPCIQNMQLQAGDTVTFSRIDPGGKLVIGCRKATNSVDMQEAEAPALPNCLSREASPSSTDKILPAKNKEHDSMENGDASKQYMHITDKKKSRNIGSKSKRLSMHSDDAMELRVTWEEAQELLRPPPSVKPNVVMVETYEFEEYDEPPVFGKRTIFTVRVSGEQEQWGQCDSCSKWRRMPWDFLLPPKWTCSDNSWDPNRCSCSAPEERSTRELERTVGLDEDFKRRKVVEEETFEEHEPSGLDALATAAVLGDSARDLDEPSLVGTTTRHPRHRPGCTCIVCIQPPSGKGKHKPTCACNVCLTVKRRFKTLMLRKKKKQQERRLEVGRGKDDSALHREDGRGINADSRRCFGNGRGAGVEAGESSKGRLDLNCDPEREDEMEFGLYFVPKTEGEGQRQGCPASEEHFLAAADKDKAEGKTEGG